MLPYGPKLTPLDVAKRGFYVNPWDANTYYNITANYSVSYDTLTTAYGEMWVPTGKARVMFNCILYPVSDGIATYTRLLVDGVTPYLVGYQYANGGGWAVISQFQFTVVNLDPTRKHTFQVQMANSGAGQSVYAYHGSSNWPLSFWGIPITDEAAIAY